MERLPLAEAARCLGIPVTAARKRVARGTLPAVKVDGQWYVDLPASTAHGVPGGLPDGHPTGTPLSSPSLGLAAAQAAEIAFLRAELEARRREVERLHTLLAQAQARVLPAATEVTTPASIAPQAAVETPQRLRWWQALFRG